MHVTQINMLESSVFIWKCLVLFRKKPCFSKNIKTLVYTHFHYYKNEIKLLTCQEFKHYAFSSRRHLTWPSANQLLSKILNKYYLCVKKN